MARDSAPRFRRGDSISVSKLNRVAEMAARALDVQGPNLSVGSDGVRLRPLQEDSFLAEILGNDGGSPVKHSWRAVVENANGTISAAEPAFAGSTTMMWAVFPGGGAVPDNSLVRLRKGLSGEWYEIVAWTRLHLLDISGRTGTVNDVLSAQFLRTVVSGTPGATVVTPDDASKIREGDVNLLNDQVLGDGRKIFSDQVVINADGITNRTDDNAHLVVRSSQYPTPFTNLLTVADSDAASFQSAYVSIGDHVMPGQLAVHGTAWIAGNAGIGSAINVGNNIDAGFDFTGTSLEPYQPVGGIFDPQQGYAGLGLYLYRAGYQCVLFPNTAPLGGLATPSYCVASVALNDYTLHVGQTGGIGPESAFTGGILTDGGEASFGELASANTITSTVMSDFAEAAQDAVGAMCTDGTLQYDDATPYLRRAAISGDVTIGAGSNSATISDDAVTNAKAADVPEGSIKGRQAGSGSGDPEDLTPGEARTVLELGELATRDAADDVGALTDGSGGSPDQSIEALNDPTDSPADADALRDDLVANLLPSIRNNFADLAAQMNDFRAKLQAKGIMD